MKNQPQLKKIRNFYHWTHGALTIFVFIASFLVSFYVSRALNPEREIQDFFWNLSDFEFLAFIFISLGMIFGKMKIQSHFQREAKKRFVEIIDCEF